MATLLSSPRCKCQRPFQQEAEEASPASAERSSLTLDTNSLVQRSGKPRGYFFHQSNGTVSLGSSIKLFHIKRHAHNGFSPPRRLRVLAGLCTAMLLDKGGRGDLDCDAGPGEHVFYLRGSLKSPEASACSARVAICHRWCRGQITNP